MVAAGLDPSTFTLEGVQAMFDQYVDEDDNNVIGGKIFLSYVYLSAANLIFSRGDGTAM